MKITKPKKNQILLEDDSFKAFNLEVESKTGLNNTEINDIYEAFILGYRVPNMDASKQMFLGNAVSLMTLFSSMLENMINCGVIDEEGLDYMVNKIKQFRRINDERKNDIRESN